LVSKVCTRCDVDRPIKEYYRDTSHEDGYGSHCKSCKAVTFAAYYATKRACLVGLIANARQHAKDVADGRNISVNITIDELQSMDAEQGSLCAISGKPLVFARLSNWQASLDRIDDNGDYEKLNCRLVALEFNMNLKWTSALLRRVRDNRAATVHPQFDEIVNDLKTNHRSMSNRGESYYEWKVEIIENKSVIFCHKCDAYKPVDDFLDTCIAEGCSDCRPKRRSAYKATWHGALRRLVDAAKYSTARRNARGRNLECNIKYNHLVNMFEAQQGLCKYSNVPLSNEGDFKVSLERQNTGIGYNTVNACLIARCFQSIDRSLGREGVESAGWNVEKVNYVCS
jgi:hypothetical protein